VMGRRIAAGFPLAGPAAGAERETGAEAGAGGGNGTEVRAGRVTRTEVGAGRDTGTEVRAGNGRDMAEAGADGPELTVSQRQNLDGVYRLVRNKNLIESERVRSRNFVIFGPGYRGASREDGAVHGPPEVEFSGEDDEEDVSVGGGAEQEEDAELTGWVEDDEGRVREVVSAGGERDLRVLRYKIQKDLNAARNKAIAFSQIGVPGAAREALDNLDFDGQQLYLQRLELISIQEFEDINDAASTTAYFDKLRLILGALDAANNDARSKITNVKARLANYKTHATVLQQNVLMDLAKLQREVEKEQQQHDVLTIESLKFFTCVDRYFSLLQLNPLEIRGVDRQQWFLEIASGQYVHNCRRREKFHEAQTVQGNLNELAKMIKEVRLRFLLASSAKLSVGPRQ
jgi:hypothetical protein